MINVVICDASVLSAYIFATLNIFASIDSINSMNCTLGARKMWGRVIIIMDLKQKVIHQLT